MLGSLVSVMRTASNKLRAGRERESSNSAAGEAQTVKASGTIIPGSENGNWPTAYKASASHQSFKHAIKTCAGQGDVVECFHVQFVCRFLPSQESGLLIVSKTQISLTQPIGKKRGHRAI